MCYNTINNNNVIIAIIIINCIVAFQNVQINRKLLLAIYPFMIGLCYSTIIQELIKTYLKPS